jgi:hypothetical protein
VIRVERAREPGSFDEKVRQPGLEAIRELVGEPPLRKRRGRKRQKVADAREKLPADAFPSFWTSALPDLRRAFGGRCAFLGLYIHEGTGTGTVDHFVAKSADWALVYEWSNYRYAAHRINALKGTTEVVDPFEVGDDWFELELVGFQIKPGRGAPAARKDAVANTCRVLNADAFCRERALYAQWFAEGMTSSDLEQLAPFVVRELRRQGWAHASSERG